MLKRLNIDLERELPVGGIAGERKSQLLSQAREAVQVRLTKKIDSLLSARDRQKLNSFQDNDADAGKFLRNRLPAGGLAHPFRLPDVVVKDFLDQRDHCLHPAPRPRRRVRPRAKSKAT